MIKQDDYDLEDEYDIDLENAQAPQLARAPSSLVDKGLPAFIIDKVDESSKGNMIPISSAGTAREIE